MPEATRVMVTGGAGFIGSELAHQLIDQGYNVTVVDNLTNGKMANLDDIQNDRLTFCEVDIRDQEAMAPLFDEIKIIFHLACLGVRHSIHSPIENHNVNADATLKLLELARASDVERFLYVSSSEVYGTAHTVPMDESHSTIPHTVYGASKLAGECYTRAYHDTYGMDTVIVRPFNAYGPRCHHEGDSGEVIPKFLLRSMTGQPLIVFGEGTQTRDFTYVGDTARGIIAIAETSATRGQTLNLGSAKEITIVELAAKVSQVAGQNVANIVYEDERPGDVMRLYSNSDRVKALTGFEPKIGLIEGLTRLKDWYQSLGAPPEELLQDEVVKNWQR